MNIYYWFPLHYWFSFHQKILMHAHACIKACSNQRKYQHVGYLVSHWGDLMDMYENSLLRAAVWSQLNGQLKLVKIQMAWRSWECSNRNPNSKLQSEVIIFLGLMWCFRNLKHAVNIEFEWIYKTHVFFNINTKIILSFI